MNKVQLPASSSRFTGSTYSPGKPASLGKQVTILTSKHSCMDPVALRLMEGHG